MYVLNCIYTRLYRSQGERWSREDIASIEALIRYWPLSTNEVVHEAGQIDRGSNPSTGQSYG